MKVLLVFLILNMTYAGTLEVMSYNVENLFDTIHDEGKNDWTFMPNSKRKKEECSKVRSNYRKQECFGIDWSEKHLAIKLDQIKDVILKERKKLPEILGLVEIENNHVIGQLAKVLGYKKYVVSDSPDRRGIDLALLYKDIKGLKFIAKREIVIKGKYFKKRATRNILEVEFLIDGKHSLHIFVNHWPSLGNPDHARVSAATALKNRIKEIKSENKSAHTIAMGDFNTIEKLKKKGNKHPFRDVFLKDSNMKNLFTVFSEDKKIKQEIKKLLPPGSYYYKRGSTWNMLDRVFISQSLLDDKGLEVSVSSFRIYAPDFITEKFENHFDDEDYGDRNFQSSTFGTPKRYDHKARDKKTAGYSDHFPLTYNLIF